MNTEERVLSGPGEGGSVSQGTGNRLGAPCSLPRT